MTISTLPPAPQTIDPTNFASKADALVAALPTFVTEANATAIAMNLNSTNATSTTSLTIATGAQTLTTQTAKSYQIGMSVKIASTANGANWMLGDVTAYNSGTGSLTVQVSDINGSGGPLTAWTISQCAPKGAAPGANIDITSLGGLTTPLSVAQGGTGLTNNASFIKAAFIQAGTNNTASYSVTLNVCTVTHVGHTRITGDKVYVSASTGTLPAGLYTITSTTSTTYLFSVVTANTTGLISYSYYDVIYGCSIVPTSTLAANVTFLTPMNNVRYAVVFNQLVATTNLITISNKTTTGFTITSAGPVTQTDYIVV